MFRTTIAVLTLAAVAFGAQAQSAGSTKKAAPATSHEQAKSQAEGLALATETVERISQAQLDISARVLTGSAKCEFNQEVSITPMTGHPGHFKVAFKDATYTMVPEETTTGAVRLMDRRHGVIWLQIPVKSMLMNQKLGQRMVDNCTLSEQRASR